MFLFVGYQLWGTGIEAAQSQQRLESSFEELSPADTASTQGPIVVAEGDPIASIEMPAIGVKKYVVAGVETADLKKGPGHYPDTPFPGELGNSAIAGHRTTYGEPFRRLDELSVGDEIIVTDLIGRRFIYLVTDQKIVSPSDSWVVDTVDWSKATLTLTTCHPEFSAKQRLIVFATLDTSLSDVAVDPAATYRKTTDAGSSDGSPPDTSVVDDSALISPEDASPPDADVFDKGWFSDPSAFPHVAAWVIAEILIVLLCWSIAKRFRNRAIGAVVGVLPFFLVLYFVFQNVNRLLPPNL